MSGRRKRVRGERLARWLLRLYPGSFRVRHGREVLGAFRAEVRGGGGALRALLDLAISLPGAHLTRLRRLGGGEGRRLAAGWGNDARLALRRFVREPVLHGVVVLTVGLGVGASTAIFSAVWAVVLRPLPYDAPGRLVRIFGTQDGEVEPVSLADALDWRDASRTLESVAMFDLAGTQIDTDDGRDVVGSADVSANLFATLGVEAAVGRLFAPGEDQGPSRSVVLSYDFWRTRFAADPGVTGKELVLEGEPHTIVGVLPEDYQDPVPHPDYPVGLYTLFDLIPSDLVRNQHSFEAVGRLADGATLERAQSEMDALAAEIQERFPEGKAGRGVRLAPLDRALLGDARSALWVLLGAVGLVLLIACANVGSVLLARNAVRGREVSVRMALGAGRGRLVRELLTESLILGLAGGALGTALAWVGHRELLATVSTRIPRIAEAHLSLPVLCFAVSVSVLAAVLFGVLPALRATRTDPARALAVSGGRTRSAGRSLRRILDGLALTEMALSVVLLVGAGLLARSFARLVSVDAGFDAHRVLTFRLAHELRNDPDRLYELQDRLGERLEGLGSVQAAGAVNFLPLTGNWACIPFTVEDRARAPGDDPCAEFQTVTSKYFRAMGIRILEGRSLSAGDDASGDPVVVINRAMAEAYWGDPGSALGRRMKWGRPEGRGSWRTVVGVVADVRHFGLAEDPEPEVYMTYRQGRDISTVFAVRLSAGADPRSLVPSLRSLVKEVDPGLEVSRISTMEELVRSNVAEPRFRTLLLGLFAGLALTISLVGVYGVLSYGAARRAREIAMRMVLGARAPRVVGGVVLRAAFLALGAVAIGGAAAWWLSSLLEAFLFDVPRADPVTFVGVATLIVGMALAASWLPARRVAGVDPMEALRD